MKRGVYRLAGHTVEIRSMYSRVHAMCRRYASTAPPELIVQTEPEDLDYERAHCDGAFSDAYLETLAVYRRLTAALLEHDVLLFHASAVAVDGAGYLFTAPSGTGKSTHTALWRELLGARAVMVNDDKPLLHITEQGVTVYGTPWSGKHTLDTDIHVPVRALCVLRQAPENTIAPLTPYDALPVLLQQSNRPPEQDALLRTLRLIERLGESVRLYTLGCRPDLAAARLAYETMAERPLRDFT